MEHFLATHFVTMNFFAYSRKRYFNEIYYEVELNREVEDFVRNLTIELKGKKFWKRYARKGDQRLIRGLWHIQFGSTRDLPHAHIQLEKPVWCDECRFIKAKGKYKGRPKSISPAPILELLQGGLSMRKTADQLGISLSTVQRVKIENRLVVGVNDR